MPYRVLRRFLHPALVAMALVGPAVAADLDYLPDPATEPAPMGVYREEPIEEQIAPLPPPAPRAEPFYAPRFTAGPRFAPPSADCRTIVKHRIDEDGAEVERRIRICDERLTDGPALGPRLRPSVYGPPHPVPPGHIPDGRWDDPRW